MKHKRLLIFVLLIAAIFLLDRHYGWSAYLADPAQLPLLQAALRENMAAAIGLYMLLTVVGCVALALPGLIFALAAGLLFGPVWGTLACVSAATVGAALAFLVGRFFLRDALQPWLTRSPRLRSLLFEQTGQRDIYLLMITRLLPIFPYNLQNFAYGITNIRFWRYTVYSFIFMLPGTAAYTVAASGFADAQHRMLYWGLAALLLLALCCCGLLLNRKQSYFFRYYPGTSAPSLLFPGCYFPAYFPQTTRALGELAAQHGAACAFDCCGKPSSTINPNIEAQLQRLQVQELITVCPNCYAHLRGRLSVPVVSIYDKLAEWGVTNMREATGQVFIPCPDRRGKEQLQQICNVLPNYLLEPIAHVLCCGLGKGFTYDDSIKQQISGTLYTYCASCAGQFQRKGLRPVRHLLAEILGVEETPDTARSLYNRWQFKKG